MPKTVENATVWGDTTRLYPMGQEGGLIVRGAAFRAAEYPPSESDIANTCLIESGDQLTECLPDVWRKAVPHFLAIGPVALQIAC